MHEEIRKKKNNKTNYILYKTSRSAEQKILRFRKNEKTTEALEVEEGSTQQKIKPI